MGCGVGAGYGARISGHLDGEGVPANGLRGSSSSGWVGIRTNGAGLGARQPGIYGSEVPLCKAGTQGAWWVWAPQCLASRAPRERDTDME